MSDLGQAFLDESRRYLSRDFLPKIREAVERLSEEDVWWKPNPASNSIGNLLLHLSGNVGQWILSSFGGSENTRRRDLEFAPEDQCDRATLLTHLTDRVDAADALLSELNPTALDRRIEIHAREVTGFEALYHVVEHFSMHTGQILYIAKLRLGEDLSFYEVVDGVPRAKWGK